MTKNATHTPVRIALREGSTLRASVADGLKAVNTAHRGCFDAVVRPAFADSLDLDEAMKKGHEKENRWDYLLGHDPSGEMVAVEPHSAKQDEITTVIRKRKAARDQLKAHFRDGVRVSKWLWVASGKVHFANTEKARLRLDQGGIEFVGTRVTARHLPEVKAQEEKRQGARDRRHRQGKR